MPSARAAQQQQTADISEQGAVLPEHGSGEDVPRAAVRAGAVQIGHFGEHGQVVSPTALEAWASCPHAYFVRRLGVEPPGTPEDLGRDQPAGGGQLDP